MSERTMFIASVVCTVFHALIVLYWVEEIPHVSKHYYFFLEVTVICLADAFSMTTAGSPAWCIWGSSMQIGPGGQTLSS